MLSRSSISPAAYRGPRVDGDGVSVDVAGGGARCAATSASHRCRSAQTVILDGSRARQTTTFDLNRWGPRYRTVSLVC
ncbi:hypothetical protein FOCC_FOCC000689 [Frankliniella occidentalis]|nr:hypothetical protein FOCC_FOCC000689 [Frankliniella occidentalis]